MLRSLDAVLRLIEELTMEEEVFDQWTVARGQTKSNC